NPRSVRVSKLGGTATNLRPRFRHGSQRAPFPQRTRNSAHLCANGVVGSYARPKCAFQETRAERTLLQIVVQSPLFWLGDKESNLEPTAWGQLPEWHGEHSESRRSPVRLRSWFYPTLDR